MIYFNYGLTRPTGFSWILARFYYYCCWWCVPGWDYMVAVVTSSSPAQSELLTTTRATSETNLLWWLQAWLQHKLSLIQRLIRWKTKLLLWQVRMILIPNFDLLNYNLVKPAWLSALSPTLKIIKNIFAFLISWKTSKLIPYFSSSWFSFVFPLQKWIELLCVANK